MGAFIADIVARVAGSTLAQLLLFCLFSLVVALFVLHRLSGRRSRLRSRLQDANSELEELRGRDPLTGLLTRAELEALLEPEVAQADHNQGSLSLLYVGLDGFRAINEGYGMRIGDGLLVAVAERLQTFRGQAIPVCPSGR